MSDSDATIIRRAEKRLIELSVEIANWREALRGVAGRMDTPGVAVAADWLLQARIITESAHAAMSGDCLEAARVLGEVKEF